MPGGYGSGALRVAGSSRCHGCDGTPDAAAADHLRLPVDWGCRAGAAAGRNWIGCRTRHERKGSNVTISLRGDVGRSLAARLTALLPGASSPFVTQSELRGLVESDRSDIERQVRQAEWMMRHPHRGMSAAPYPLMGDWRRFLRWIDGVIQHLEQPRPVPELEHLIRAWQDRRGNIVAPNLRWHRRADVIAV